MVDSFALFCDATWHFVTVGMGAPIRTGIRRSELEASARLLKLTITDKIFSDLRIMEEEALKWWARKR